MANEKDPTNGFLGMRSFYLDAYGSEKKFESWLTL